MKEIHLYLIYGKKQDKYYVYDKFPDHMVMLSPVELVVTNCYSSAFLDVVALKTKGKYFRKLDRREAKNKDLKQCNIYIMYARNFSFIKKCFLDK